MACFPRDRSPCRDGYDAKAVEIGDIGWERAREAFNAANPPGQKWARSAEDLNYAQGEYRALCDRVPKR